MISDLIMSLVFIGLLPMGIYILFNTELVVEKFTAFAIKNSRSSYMSPHGWNMFVMKMIGGVSTLLGIMGILLLIQSLS